MTTSKDVINLANYLVGQKVTDPTNPYGGQCTTLINQVMKRLYAGKYNFNYTNAKDGLAKAKSQGLEVFYNNPNDPNQIPQEGDIVVCWWGAGDDFGHILICVSSDINGMHTIEQNIDGWKDENGNGENDQLEEGGGGYTRKHYRGYTGVIGWFRLPYDEKPKPKKQETKKNILMEDDSMFIVTAPGRGQALMQGGVFLPILYKDTPKAFTTKGIPVITVDVKTFDEWQKRSNLVYISDGSAKKLAETMVRVQESAKK